MGLESPKYFINHIKILPSLCATSCIHLPACSEASASVFILYFYKNIHLESCAHSLRNVAQKFRSPLFRRYDPQSSHVTVLINRERKTGWPNQASNTTEKKESTVLKKACLFSKQLL